VLPSAADMTAIRASVDAAGVCVVSSLLPATPGTTPTDATTAHTVCSTWDAHSIWDAQDATIVAIATIIHGREDADPTQPTAAKLHTSA